MKQFSAKMGFQTPL